MAAAATKSKSAQSEPGIIAQWRANATGFAGLVLSLVQLVLHGLWVALTESLAAGGEAITLASWQAWLIVGLVLVSGVTTMVALFLSLHGCIHGRPRTPAAVGLMISFFTGSLVTFVLLLTALASGAAS